MGFQFLSTKFPETAFEQPVAYVRRLPEVQCIGNEFKTIWLGAKLFDHSHACTYTCMWVYFVFMLFMKQSYKVEMLLSFFLSTNHSLTLFLKDLGNKRHDKHIKLSNREGIQL